MGFIVGHMVFVFTIAGFIVPRWLDVFIIPERRNDWKQPTAPGMIRDVDEGQEADSLEAVLSTSPAVDEEKKKKKDDELAEGDMFRGNSNGGGSLPRHSSGSTATLGAPRGDNSHVPMTQTT